MAGMLHAPVAGIGMSPREARAPACPSPQSTAKWSAQASAGPVATRATRRRLRTRFRMVVSRLAWLASLTLLLVDVERISET
jgi:hypothetical protein